MQVNIYNLEGRETGEMLELSDSVFGVKVNPELVHEAFVIQSGNQRQPWADVKKRGEVSGGGRKPWAQKGSGRARHGSIRSPIWKGGGVAFGPLTARNYKRKLNQKQRRQAVRMCLSGRAQEGALWVVKDFAFAEAKTKLFARLLAVLPAKQKSFLILTDGKDAAALKMTRNIPRVETMRAEDVNVIKLLSKPAIFTTVAGVKKLEKIFQK